jgi:chaperone required for assembly of F1-ATPase
MDSGWLTPADGQTQRTRQEQPPVRMEFLSPWKQAIMESRQARTVSILLAAQLNRQRVELEKQVAISRHQRFVLFDRLSYFFPLIEQ